MALISLLEQNLLNNLRLHRSIFSFCSYVPPFLQSFSNLVFFVVYGEIMNERKLLGRQ